jgi:hypothetical protein
MMSEGRTGPVSSSLKILVVATLTALTLPVAARADDWTGKPDKGSQFSPNPSLGG